MLPQASCCCTSGATVGFKRQLLSFDPLFYIMWSFVFLTTFFLFMTSLNVFILSASVCPVWRFHYTTNKLLHDDSSSMIMFVCLCVCLVYVIIMCHRPDFHSSGWILCDLDQTKSIDKVNLQPKETNVLNCKHIITKQPTLDQWVRRKTE